MVTGLNEASSMWQVQRSPLAKRKEKAKKKERKKEMSMLTLIASYRIVGVNIYNFWLKLAKHKMFKIKLLQFKYL